MAHGPGEQAVGGDGGRWSLLRDGPTWLVLAVAAAATAGAYPRLPARMAVHWNLAGEPDRWAPKAFAAWFGLALAVAIYLLMGWLPAIDPRRDSYRRFAGAYRLARQALVLTLLGVHAVVVLSGLGVPVAVDRAVPLGVGILFVLLGNVLGQVRPNYFFGIRTPWTLAEEEVWRRTHRVGARILVLAGLVSIAGALRGGAWAVAGVVAAAVGAGLGNMAYSYRVWRELQARRGIG